MINRMTRKVLVAGIAALLVAPATWAAVTPFSQNFEALNALDPNAVSGVGFVISGTVFNGDTVNPPYGAFKFFYGNFPAPNGGSGFSAIAGGEGGDPQGQQYLNVYNDYNCCAPISGVLQGHNDTTAPFDFVQSNVLQEQTIGPADIGTKWTLKFDAKLPSSLGCEPTTVSDCIAFIKTLDPSAGFAETNLVTFDAQTLSNANWSTQTLSIDLSNPLLNGQILQFGFTSVTRQGANTGVYYDNISFAPDADLDGVADALDNCTLAANNSGLNVQVDSNGDGYGNLCDADINNTDLVTATDFNLLRACINLPGYPTGTAQCQASDMNASGTVTATDFNLLRARINTVPGPSGLACAGTIPCLSP